MAIRTGIFHERTGILRIISIIFSVVALILVARFYYAGEPMEESFYYGNIVCLALSCLFLLLILLGMWEENDLVRQLDKIFHCLGAVLMIVSACFFIYRVDQTKSAIIPLESSTFYERRAAGGAFGLFYGIMLAVIGFNKLP